jgi:hypothetical protein
MNKNKISYAILIPDNLHDSKIGDLDICLKLIEKEKRVFLLGTIDVRTEGKEWLDKLDKLFKKGKIKGIKIFPGHDPIYPNDKRLSQIYKLCIKYNYPMVIHTGWNSNDSKVAKYNDPKYIIDIAKKFPKLKIIISHYYWPKVEYCYNITRNFSNIYFDTSALADEEVIRETGLEKIKKVLEKSIQDNPNSVLFGTDYAMCDTKKHLELVNSLSISKKDLEKILWKNANKLFRLKI